MSKHRLTAMCKPAAQSAKNQHTKKRKKVTFAPTLETGAQESANVDEDEILPAVRKVDNDEPLADMTGAAGVPKHSLLESDAEKARITAFDITDALDDGGHFDVSNDDGVIPSSLQATVRTEAEDAADFTSDDDEGPARTDTRERDAWADTIDDAPASTANGDDKPAAAKRQKRAVANSSNVVVLSKASAVAGLVRLLRAGETGAQAITRLKREGQAEELEKVTDLCHGLLGHGVYSAYELSLEEVRRLMSWDLAWGRRSPKPNVKCHGPHDAATMERWQAARYFSQKGKVAWTRPHAARHVPWARAGVVFAPTPS